jgi:hypothetical protein
MQVKIYNWILKNKEKLWERDAQNLGGACDDIVVLQTSHFGYIYW